RAAARLDLARGVGADLLVERVASARDLVGVLAPGPGVDQAGGAIERGVRRLLALVAVEVAGGLLAQVVDAHDASPSVGPCALRFPRRSALRIWNDDDVPCDTELSGIDSRLTPLGRAGRCCTRRNPWT